MGFFSFLKGIFSTDKDGKISIRDTKYEGEQLSIMVSLYAIFAAIQTKANLIANCEYKTYKDGKEIKGLEWVRLNFSPNVNQSATEFWTEVYCKLFYDEEVLIFDYNGQMIIADSFEKDEYAVREHLFRNVTRGDFTYNRVFRSSEVYYLSYKNESARFLKMGLLQRYDELIGSASESYKKAGGEKILLNVPQGARGSPQDQEDFKDLMNNRFKSFFQNRNAVLPLYKGMQGAFHSSASSGKEVDDIQKMTSEALKQAALVYGISPALITGDVAGIKEALDWTLTVGIDPPVNAMSEEITNKQFSAAEISSGNYIIGDTTNIKHIDIFDIANSAEKLIFSAMMNPDEVREKAGLQKTGEEWAQKYYLTKNADPVDSLPSMSSEGGEKV